MRTAGVNVTRDQSELGFWELARYAPDPHLAAHVRSYCGYVERGGTPLARRELPSDEIIVVLGLGPPIRVDGEPRGSFVAGLNGAPALTEHDGVQEGLQVNLTPLGAYRLFGPPELGVPGQVVDLEDLLGARAGSLVERLFETHGWEARFALVETAIAGRLEERAPASPDVAWAWRRLTETEGRLPISAVTNELGCSRRHLTTRFREQIGLAPKAFARILRFDRAVRRLRSEGGGSLAEIAHDAGYYDQSHFNRDFRAFAGLTPTELVAHELPAGRGLSGT
jgi:AraC-like DNA-binding protein